ncbi:MAG: nucleotidyltransferase family protein [Rhizobacter sp.]|jgi:molybdenum cofactor cytidylyltransferase|nr:nucleotidyltransferase family protein [Burkholderiaceae bacterium]MCO5125098.1 nucleotidyltransferase family protein [Rhizobacter sp.]
MSGPVVVVLAAGRGSRFQSPEHKLVQPFGASSVLGTTLGKVLASQLPMVVVATAAMSEVAGRSVATRDVVVVPEVGQTRTLPLGMGYSIACGVGARPDATGWLVLPGDMPMVKPETLQAVARALEDHTIAYAQYRGRRGHPVGFAAELFSELATLSGDDGARRLIARYPAHGVEVDDPGVLIDIDTEADLASLRASTSPAAPQPHP